MNAKWDACSPRATAAAILGARQGRLAVRISPARRIISAATWLLLLGAFTSAAPAQMREVVIEGATILTGDGRVIESGGIAYSGGKITKLGKRAEASMLARKIDGRGKVVTPGFIDVWSSIAVADTAASGAAAYRAADEFDRFDADALRASLSQGVVAAYIPARSREGVGGLGAVVRLNPNTSRDAAVLKDDAALCIRLGTGDDRALARVQSAAAIRQAFRDAQDYRKAREDYEEDLKEYEKKLKERVEKGDVEAGEAVERPVEAPRPAPAEERPQQRGRRRRGGPTAEGQEKPEGEEKAAPAEDVQKPQEPLRDRNKDVLIRVLDGEIPVRCEAHRPEDVLNILEIAEEFGFRLMLEGAAGAHYFAKELKDADVTVILGSPRSTMLFEYGSLRHDRADLGAALAAAGVSVYIGTGPDSPDGNATRSLAMRAALEAGRGFDSSMLLKRVTFDAARLLGIDEECGRLAVGRPADLVLWSDDPFGAIAKVEMVVLNGEEVYRAKKEKGGDE